MKRNQPSHVISKFEIKPRQVYDKNDTKHNIKTCQKRDKTIRLKIWCFRVINFNKGMVGMFFFGSNIVSSCNFQTSRMFLYFL